MSESFKEVEQVKNQLFSLKSKLPILQKKIKKWICMNNADVSKKDFTLLIDF